MSEPKYTTGLILAGGAGRRVGGLDKGLLPFRDSTLVAHVVARMLPQVDRLLISCNRNIEQYAKLAETTAVDRRRGFQGPLAGLEAAIPCIDTEFLLIAPCDTPLLPADLCVRLLAAIDSNQGGHAEISYAHDGVRAQYLCAAIRSTCLSSLPEYLNQGHRAVRDWYARQTCEIIDFSDQPDCFSNYNHPDHGQ